MKTRELSLATFVLAAFGASIAACSAEGTTAAPENVSFAGNPVGSAGGAVIPGGGSAGALVSTAGATSGPGGAPAAAGAPAAGGAAGAGTSFGGAPPAAGAAGATQTVGCVAAVGTAADLSIDDFEDGDNAIQLIGGRKGFWYSYNDGSATQVPTTSATMPFKPTAPGRSATSLLAAHSSGPAFTKWGAGLGVDFNNLPSQSCPYNASAYAGIKFWAKSSSALKAMVQIPATTAKQSVTDSATCSSTTMCNDHYYIPIAVSTGWVQYTITFADRTTFKQEGWGTPAAWSAAALLGMQFQVGMGVAFDFGIDDLTFF